MQTSPTQHSGLSTQDCLARLPHGYPFILVDRVLMITPGQWAVTVKSVSQDDALVDAAGIVPPMLLAEVMAQTAGLAVAAEMPGQRAAVLVQIDRFRCRPPVRAGERLLVAARVVRRFGPNVKARASIRVSGRQRAAGELVLHFPPLPSP